MSSASRSASREPRSPAKASSTWPPVSAVINRQVSYVPGDVALWPALTGGQVLDALAGLRGSRDAERGGVRGAPGRHGSQPSTLTLPPSGR